MNLPNRFHILFGGRKYLFEKKGDIYMCGITPHLEVDIVKRIKEKVWIFVNTEKFENHRKRLLEA